MCRLSGATDNAGQRRPARRRTDGKSRRPVPRSRTGRPEVSPGRP
ncbi:hypothetical protein SSCG_03774 [Streptomyces clavuligerus]|nr:hypothetical protein SSCG_03774 [Streptomyces clavuligerus]